MLLAFKEIARAKVCFALLIAAIALLVFLILFQQSLQSEQVMELIQGEMKSRDIAAIVVTHDEP